MSTEPETTATSTPRVGWRFIAALLGCLALFLLLRLRWMGHLLSWDEAMNLCATRAFAAGGHDPYSGWIWRYPPLFSVVLMAARPLAAGFAVRAEWIPIFVGVLQILALAMLNRRLFGEGPALWSCLAYSVMPGAVFFGVWLKQDCLVALMGLLAIYCCARKKWMWAGLALGLAFLSKEMAIFYAIGIALILHTQRRYGPLAMIAAISFLMTIWWYLFFSNSARQFVQFAAGVTDQSANFLIWTKPWYYYGEHLIRDVGWLGLALVVAGMVCLRREDGPRLWPAAVFGPGLLIITCASGKTPWFLMALYPAMATLQGVAAFEIWQRFRRRYPILAPSRLVPAAATAAAAFLLARPLIGETYEEAMTIKDPALRQSAAGSRQAAEALNHLVKDGEKVLITPMFYYEQFGYSAPCPIFVIYLKDMPVLIRPCNLKAGDFIEAVRKYRLDWAMVSPPAGRAEQVFLNTVAHDCGLHPVVLDACYIFHTTPICAHAAP